MSGTDVPAAELFSSAADLYTRYREPYPPQLWERLVASLGLDGTQRALDLGAGSGQVAIPLSRHVASVVAVDPNDEMLAAGRAEARARQGGTIDWRPGDSTGLRSLGLGGLDLVTMGRAFHWMDRPAVLADLDTMVAPDGAVALLHVGWRTFTSRHPAATRNGDDPVAAAYRGAAGRHIAEGALEAALSPVPGWADHSEVVGRSAFSRLLTEEWLYDVDRGIDEVVGLTMSYSPTTPRRLGDRRAAYESDLRKALLDIEPSGRFVIPVRAELLLARRPADAADEAPHARRRPPSRMTRSHRYP